MADNETVEWKRQQLVETAARGSPIGVGSPAHHTAHRDAVVESHRPRVEPRPVMLRSSYVVHQVSDYQRPRRPVHECALFQSKTVDLQLIDDTRKGWLRC